MGRGRAPGVRVRVPLSAETLKLSGLVPRTARMGDQEAEQAGAYVRPVSAASSNAAGAPLPGPGDAPGRGPPG